MRDAAMMTIRSSRCEFVEKMRDPSHVHALTVEEVPAILMAFTEPAGMQR